MLGGEGEEGLIQLAANEIFRIAKSDQQRQIKIKCSFFQCLHATSARPAINQGLPKVQKAYYGESGQV